MGMSVGIPLSTGNHSIQGPFSFQKRNGRRVFGAVMSDFQDSDPPPDGPFSKLLQKLPFALPFNIPCQKRAEIPVRNLQHNRIFVWLQISFLLFRMKAGKGKPVIFQHLSFAEISDRNPSFSGRLCQGKIPFRPCLLCNIRQHQIFHPDSLLLPRFQKFPYSAAVILVRVGHKDSLQR